MLICENCGFLIAEEDAPIHYETHDIDTGIGFKTLETECFIEDCTCGGKFVKAKKCKKCKEFFLQEEDFDFCNECFRRGKND